CIFWASPRKRLPFANSSLSNRAFLIQSCRRPKLETKQKHGGIRNSQPPPTLGCNCVDELKQCNVQGSVTTYRVWLLRALPVPYKW
ncbi:hypothetical protein CNYM01_05683, partial [Colletotrichum nymphaeae SA-01]